MYTSQGRNNICLEWENVGWLAYEEVIRDLTDIFPRLKLVEWFLKTFICASRGRPIPFWQCEIVRDDSTGTYSLKRQLRNWPHLHPFTTLEPWTPRRGIQYADDEDYGKANTRGL